MSADILQKFLGRRLIDVGEDDARLDKLRAAAEDFSSSTRTNRRNALRHALVAVDPNAPADDPTWNDISPFVEKHWNTYKSRFAEQPTALFRAVILEGLRRAQREDLAIGACLITSVRNLVPRLTDASSEFEIWKDLLQEAERNVTQRAIVEWSIEISGPANSEMKVATIDRNSLAQALKSAAGPEGSSPNPNWPSANAPWLSEFGNRAANAIGNSIDAAVASLGNGMESRLTGTSMQSARSIQRRSELLWWKAAMYSETAATNYRAIDPAVATVLMAIDLHKIVPSYCPASVESFLRETVRSIEEAQASLTMGKFFTELQKAVGRDVIAHVLSPHRQTAGRGPLIAVLSDILAGGDSSKSRLLSSVGVDSSTKLSLPDFAVWIFRELQALRALVEPPLLPEPVNPTDSTAIAAG